MDTDLGGMCECDIGDGEPVTYLDGPRDITTRKPHRCAECRELMPPGTRCEYFRYLLDAAFWEDRTCLPCVGISRDFCCGQRGIVYLFEEAYGWDYREVPDET